MNVGGIVVGVGLIVVALVDGFEAMVLTRRVTHRYRYARFYYHASWRIWRMLAMVMPAGRYRQALLSLFGPLSLLGLMANWVAGLIVGFAVLNWSLGTPLHAAETPDFLTALYYSGVTFFTLGYGDITPVHALGRFLAVLETGLGFSFLAVVISYMPALYQAYSQRETTISLLDGRAGSPPTAGEALLRMARGGSIEAVDALLADWERWSAHVLECHLSFPMLNFYRSQHDNQSWLAALMTVLDTCAFLLVEVKECSTYQAHLTFAMARHAAVDIALVLKVTPGPFAKDRLTAGELEALRARLMEADPEGKLNDAETAARQLKELRAMYEPFVNALAERLMFSVPRFVAEGEVVDNWQRSRWTPRPPGIGKLAAAERALDEHFE